MDIRGNALTALPEKPTKERIETALRDKMRADGLDLRAAEVAKRDRIGSLYVKNDADKLRAKSRGELSVWAHTTRTPQRGNGGELVPLFEPDNPVKRLVKVDAVTEELPVLEHQSSSDCMDLAMGARCLSMALDVANTTGAKTRIEKMLAHQAAAMHNLGMKLVEKAMLEGDRIVEASIARSTPHRAAACVEAARLTNAAAKAFAGFNEAALTIQKLRSKGKQTVTVIHQNVNVGPDGKAIVAGQIKRGKGGGSRGGGGCKK